MDSHPSMPALDDDAIVSAFGGIEIPDDEPESGEPTVHQVSQLRKLLLERARRRCEAVRLYQPMDEQRAAHMSQALRRCVLGGNRGGKTAWGAVEVAWAVMGIHPYIVYPKKDGRCYIVGKDQKKLGEVLYRKLFRPGAFKIIRDQHTGLWRAYRPLDPVDVQREHEVKPAPPLIPPRFVQSVAWENKRLNVPSMVTLVNGWELTFLTAGSKPPQGVDIDIVWFDEEITDPDWLPEMLMRLVDRRGRFFWTATPQSGTDQLLSLCEDADRLRVSEEERRAGKVPIIERFSLPFYTNKYLGEREKRTILDDPTLSDEDRRVRLDGQFAVLNFLMFPQFSRDVHCVESCEPKPEWTEEPYSYLPGGRIPDNWCRYLVIDPGSVICAVLFAAVPPGSVGDYVYLYDELYIKECSAEKLAEEVRRKTQDHVFEAFIIDARGSQRSEHGSGITVKRSYYNAFKKHGIKSRRTGHGFIDGCSDKQARCDAVRDWLRVRPDGTTKLRVVREFLPNWLEEMKRYKRKRRLNPKTGMKEVIDEPDDGKNAHLMAATQYLAAFNPTYEEPPKRRGPKTNAQMRLEQKRKRQGNRGQRSFVNLGP